MNSSIMRAKVPSTRAEQLLVMKDGEVHRKLPDGNVSIIKFDSYAFDLTDADEVGGPSHDPVRRTGTCPSS